ncbi:MAG: sodium:solute symporter family protein [Verrucomicrobiota bacterium]|jgi:SSS family solute:Na+ symporter|nr:sodium:solute symporter family protein [Verrucomicrobiota bacterium]
MDFIDYLVLAIYFSGMAAIGFWAMRQVKGQEDYFMGGRKFGKLFQTFAAFGAGTGSADPVNTARGTFANGMSGMWGVMYWLFVTPIYWISGVWYRRMRCLTLGDWFAERYESKSIGVAYALFGCFYYMVYGAMLFTAIGKVAVPLMGADLFGIPTGQVLIPLVALIVIVYGVLGGVTAAYWTDLIQGVCIILLSVLLIPFGLNAVVQKFGAEGDSWTDGFKVMHDQLPESTFTILGGTASSEFPLYAIVVIVIMNMIGIVLTPHFIVTGGGSAKSEHDARVGLVTGNFIKRFCTIGWVITALIVLTLFSERPELIADPDQAWGVATKELLGPLGIGLVGLMLACLLAAMMSSVDCYMLVCAALVVRNIYVPFIKPDAGEKECLTLGRITGAIVVIGAVVGALVIDDMFAILKQTWIVPMTFAALFWVGMYWRRATTAAGWVTVIFCVMSFFVLPRVIPFVPGIKGNPDFQTVSQIVKTKIMRKAAPADVARRQAEIIAWEKAVDRQESKPNELQVGDELKEVKITGGKSIYWSNGVKSEIQIAKENLSKTLANLSKLPLPKTEKTDAAKVSLTESITTLEIAHAESKQVARSWEEGDKTIQVITYTSPMRGEGNFRFDMLIYDKLLGIDLTKVSNAALKTLEFPFKIIAPFLVMIIASLLTKPNSKKALDRLYVKMKTPVDPDPERDEAEIDVSYAKPDRFDDRKLFPGSQFEFQRPTAMDFWGFLACFAICFGIIGLVLWVAKIGAA